LDFTLPQNETELTLLKLLVENFPPRGVVRFGTNGHSYVSYSWQDHNGVWIRCESVAQPWITKLLGILRIRRPYMKISATLGANKFEADIDNPDQQLQKLFDTWIAAQKPEAENLTGLVDQLKDTQKELDAGNKELTKTINKEK